MEVTHLTTNGDPRDYDPEEDPIKRALEEDEDQDLAEGEERDRHQ